MRHFGKVLSGTFLLCALAVLTACSHPAAHGASLTRPVPPYPVATIYLEDVTRFDRANSGLPPSGDTPKPVSAPVSDDLLTTYLFQSKLVASLEQDGYPVIRDPAQPHDFDMRVDMSYQPDDWPVANRAVHVQAFLSRPGGPVVFSAETGSENWFGSLGDFVGYSAEEMLADAAQKTSILVRSSQPR